LIRQPLGLFSFGLINIIILIFGLICFIYGLYSFFTPSVTINWKTESEVNTLGFNLTRKTVDSSNNDKLINPDLILANGTPISGFEYQFIDHDVKLGEKYLYQLQELTISGETLVLDTIDVSVKPYGILPTAIGFIVIITTLISFISRNAKVKKAA